MIGLKEKLFRSKAEGIVFALLLLSGIASCILFLPPVREVVIRLTEDLLLHRKLENPAKWSAFLMEVPLVWNALWITTFIFFHFWSKEFFAGVKTVAKDCAFMWKPALILFGIYFVACLALLRANFAYVDDQARIMKGASAGWFGFGRYLSEIFSRIIHADFYLADVSPLTQILAIAIIALTGIIFVFVLTGKKEFGAMQFIALIPFALSPYFIECLSYKYDSPYMALSVFTAVAPLLFADMRTRNYVIATVIGVLVTCTTYQVSAGIFPMLVIALCLKRYLSGEKNSDVLKFLGISAASYLGALLFFKIFLAPSFSDYVDAHIPPINEFFPTVARNYGNYFSLLLSDFKIEWLLIAAILIVAFIMLCVKNSSQKVLPSIALSVVATIFMVLLEFGVYPAFEKPLFTPRAMYGVGIFISLLAVCICSFPQKNIVPKAASALLGWSFFTFTFVYGNALYQQQEYTDFRIESAIDDLKDLKLQDETTIYIAGTIGHSPVIKNMPEKCGIIRRTVPVPFRELNTWGVYKIQNYYNIEQLMPVEISFGDKISTNVYEIPDTSSPSFITLKDTIFHTIKSDGMCIVIELK